MKKNLKKLFIAFFILSFLICTYMYVCAIEGIPTNIILFQGEELQIRTIFGISLSNSEIDNEDYETILTSAEEDNSKTDNNKYDDNLGVTNLSVKLFDTFSVKDVKVNIIERTKVVPVGEIAGLKLYTNGVLVVGMSEIKGLDNVKYKPYENSGIEEGDMIVEIGEQLVTDTEELINIVNQSEGNELKIKYLRNGETFECSIKPTQTSQTEYKLGLWVRDSAAGIGTMTYYEPSTGHFAALGHGITDVDTGDLIDISNGEFITTKILSVVKGVEGNPGKIQGSIENQRQIGTIYKNSSLGIYGYITDISATQIDMSKEMEVALRSEIELGEATILCSLEGETPKEYKIEIEKIYLNNDYDNKSMLIKVTDEELIEKTGGIIQGMSGSPIIQNGKFVGAITNVLINSPTKGYAVFADLMIKEMKEY